MENKIIEKQNDVVMGSEEKGLGEIKFTNQEGYKKYEERLMMLFNAMNNGVLEKYGLSRLNFEVEFPKVKVSHPSIKFEEILDVPTMSYNSLDKFKNEVIREFRNHLSRQSC